MRAPCTGHHSRRRRQWISSRQTPRSRCRQTESSGRVSFRARVAYPHSGQTSRRRRSATSTTIRSGSKRTLLTHTPDRRRSLENAVVTRTLSLPCKPLTLDSQQPAGEGGGRVPNQRATCENSSALQSPAHAANPAITITTSMPGDPHFGSRLDSRAASTATSTARRLRSTPGAATPARLPIGAKSGSPAETAAWATEEARGRTLDPRNHETSPSTQTERARPAALRSAPHGSAVLDSPS